MHDLKLCLYMLQEESALNARTVCTIAGEIAQNGH